MKFFKVFSNRCLTSLRCLRGEHRSRAGFMLAAAVLVFAGPSFASQQATQAPQAESQEGKNLTEVVTLGLGQAKRLYDLGAVFIDVREDDEWQLGHIKNARHVNFRRNFVELKSLEGVNQDTPLVFYCSMPECKVGPYAAAVSIEWGYTNVFYFPRGYFAWMLQDYPIELNSGVTTFAGDTIQIRKAN